MRRIFGFVCVILITLFQNYRAVEIECGTVEVIHDLIRNGNQTVIGALL